MGQPNFGVREANLAERLKRLHGETGAKAAGPSNLFPPYKRTWVAACVALLALFGVWWVWYAHPSGERLYRAHFVPDIGLPVPMKGADSIHYLFYDGMISYKEGNYTDALAKWGAVAKATGATDTLQYYAGLANMVLGDFDVALEQLAPVANDRRSAYYEEARWYLALCYLKRDEKKAAVSLLRRIPDHERASKLLKKLE